ncbi:MAG TPA: hypothetical protein VN231_06265 [Allosphingosinicella sp.]|nr:hypothetical protein [Allosphingosinicella sp.]
MYKLLIAAAAAALAAPATAQEDGFADPRDEEIAGALPPAEDIEAMAPALDRSVGALMDVDVGPILDAADPWRRRYGYGRPGRTLGALGRRDDPYFEERIRSSIYGTTAGMARMMGAFSAAAPALARSIREVERAMGAAIDDYHRRRGDPRDDREQREYYPDD